MNRNLSHWFYRDDFDGEDEEDFPEDQDESDIDEIRDCEYCNLQGNINNRFHLIGCPNGLLS
jgi:hypothetical protein